MLVNVKCEKCDETYTLNSSNTEKVQVVCKEDGQTLFITKFVCPKCGHLNIGQIDNEATNKMLGDIERYVGYRIMMKKKGKMPNRKSTAEFRKERMALKICRDELMRKYNDKHYYVGDDVVAFNCVIIG